MYHANLAGAANGYGYEHGSMYGGSVVTKGQDLEEQVSRVGGQRMKACFLRLFTHLY